MAARRRRWFVYAALAVVLACLGGTASARSGGQVVRPSPEPSPQEAPAFDIRETAAGRRARRRSTPAERRARRELRADPSTVVHVDPATATPSLVTDADGALSRRTSGSAGSVALGYVRRHRAAFGLDANDIDALDLRARDTTRSGLTVLRWTQSYRGIPAFDNSLAASVRGGRLVAVGGSPQPDLAVPTTKPRLSAAAALRRTLASLGVKRPVRAGGARGTIRQTRLTGGYGELTLFVEGARTRLAWKLFTILSPSEAYLSVVDAATGALLKRVQIVDHASGQAHDYFPGAVDGGVDTERDFPTAGDDPWLTGTSFDKLAGDNAVVYSDKDDNLGFTCNSSCTVLGAPGNADQVRPSTDEGVETAAWDYAPLVDTNPSGNRACPTSGCTWNGFTLQDSWQDNRKQAGTQLFYFVNNFHDHLKQDPGIGFDAGNFEADGPGADPVQAQVDDGANTGTGFDSGFPDSNHVNNANMLTLPETGPPGLSGALTQMYLFTGYPPYGSPGVYDVNGADDAAIVYHEYTHGLSNRLIDPAGTGALDSGQAGAMGEAWSDWYAEDYLAANGFQPDDSGTDNEVIFGAYENIDFRTQGMDCPVGSNACPGSPGMGFAGTGGYTYGDYAKIVGDPGPEVHADGEIWGETLWDLRTALLAAHPVGGPDAPDGEERVRQLVTDAMRLTQGTTPTYLSMRDAIFAANTHPADLALIRTVFQHRGMGKCASTTGSDDNSPTQSFTAFTGSCTTPVIPPAATTPTTTTPTPKTVTPTPKAARAPGFAKFSRSPRRVRASRSGRFSYAFRAGAGLSGKLKLVTVRHVAPRAGVHHKRVALARKSFKVSRRGRVRVRFKLSRRNRTILRRYKKLRVKIRVTLKNSAGLTSSNTRTFVLKAPRPSG